MVSEEEAPFAVVGVIGRQGTGKSTILSWLADGEADDPMFASASLEALLESRHTTMGVDVGATDERVIYVDCQPVFSGSVLRGLTDKEASTYLPGVAHGPEALATIQALQLGAFLFTVCHAIVVVQDPSVDIALADYLQAVSMISARVQKLDLAVGGSTHQSTASVSATRAGSTAAGTAAAGSPDGIHVPDLVFAFNRCEEADFEPRARASLGAALARLCAATTDRTPEMVLLPFEARLMDDRAPETGNHVLNTDGGFGGSVERLRQCLAGISREPLGGGRGVASTQRDWLRYAAGVWDYVRESPAVIEYFAAQQEAGFFE